MSRILVVEDEEHLAAGLRFNLEAEGHDVATVESGETVEASVAVALPEIPVGAELLLDLVCEGVTWFELSGSSPLRIPLD